MPDSLAQVPKSAGRRGFQAGCADPVFICGAGCAAGIPDEGLRDGGLVQQGQFLCSNRAAINKKAVPGVIWWRPLQLDMGVHFQTRRVLRRRHNLLAQSRIAEQSHMYAAGAVSGWVSAGIVHGNARAVTQGFAEPHGMKCPMRPASPGIAQNSAGTERRAQQVVAIVPVAEVTSKSHGKHRPHRVLCVLSRRNDIACTLVPAAATAVSPEVIFVFQFIPVDGLDGICSDQRRKVPPAVL